MKYPTKTDTMAMMRSVSVPIIELSDKEAQRALGDTTYYVEWLKRCMGNAEGKWATNLLVNKATEPTVPVETRDEEPPIPTTGWDPATAGTNPCTTHNIDGEKRRRRRIRKRRRR